ncbi:uncharacterized protein DFL_009827 [Arthrobotrys flagrans]|uniref:Uncharacterized protein n=1 Tax=Arthrobotrys flagrans TaxID=97331 RepID=A0A436ZTC3_ARTFL|nr:hypothetical protein DFL_009827 [Arthrobotrys flagrans]
MPPHILTYTAPLTSRAISHRSTDQSDQSVATILGVVFGVMGFIILLCIFTCCCGACHVRPIEEGTENSSDGHCNGGAMTGEGRICSSSTQKGQTWRTVERREEVRERVMGDRGVNVINRPGMAHLGGLRPVAFQSTPPNLGASHHRSRLNSLKPGEVRGGLRRAPPRAMSPASQVRGPGVQGPAANLAPDLRFQISEGSSSDSESIGPSPTMMPAMRAQSPPSPGIPIEPPMSPLTVLPLRTIVRPIKVHPRNAVTRPEFEDAIDDIEKFVGGQLEGMKRKIERELDEERRQRELEAFESNAIQEETINELDEERRGRHLEALGSNSRQQAMKEDIEELKERTTNLEYENQRTKNTLISIATRPKTPPLPVIINNTCTHCPNSRKGFDDDGSSDSGFGGPIRPIGPGPPGPSPSSSLGDYSSTVPGPTRFGSPPHTPPNSPPSKAPRGPFGGPDMVFPEGSLDEGSNGFQTATSEPASPRTAPRPRPNHRASIEYPMPPQLQQEVPIAPHARQPPPRASNQGFRRPPSRGPTPRPGRGFLQLGEVYLPSNPMIRPEIEELPSPKFRDMPPLRRVPNAPGHIPGGRRSIEDIRGPLPSRYPLFPENNGHRRCSRDQDIRRGRGSDLLGGLGPRDSPTGFNDLHGRGRNASITSNHVSFAPSDQFERYSAQSQGFDESSIDDSIPDPGPDISAGFQPLRRGSTRRRNSFHDAPERMGFGNHLLPDFSSDTVSVDSYNTDRIRGTARRTSSTVTEPWLKLTKPDWEGLRDSKMD